MIKSAHISWNLVGLALPLIIAAITVPLLMSGLGAERFGLLALVWGVVGYAGALDLGLGRALTQYVAGLEGEKRQQQVRTVLHTCSQLTLLSGAAVGMLLAIATLTDVTQWFSTEQVSRTELTVVLLLVALVLPVQAMSATYRGLCEAYQAFRGINIIRVALGAVTFAAPALALHLSDELVTPVLLLVVARVIALFVFRWLAQQCIADCPAGRTFDPVLARQLFQFGGWVTVSGILSPIMLQADRFSIGALLSGAVVGLYVVPYEVVVQSLVVVGAVTATVFPAFSRLAQSDPVALRLLFRRWFYRIAALMALICITIAVLAEPLLTKWLAEQFQPAMVPVAQILCLGVFANALAALFYSLIHAYGRADVTAKFHMIELPVFISLLFGLISVYGISGAAIAWTCRMILDLLLLWGYVRKHYV